MLDMAQAAIEVRGQRATQSNRTRPVAAGRRCQFPAAISYQIAGASLRGRISAAIPRQRSRLDDARFHE